MKYLQCVSLDGHWMAVVYHNFSGIWSGLVPLFLFFLGAEQVVFEEQEVKGTF